MRTRLTRIPGSIGAIARSGTGNAVFVGLMLGASGLTMLRMFLLVGLMRPIDFAVYATIVATGTFLAPVLSFGAVERTVKTFPRLAEDGQQAALIGQAWQTLLVLVKRASIGLVVVALGYLLAYEFLIYAGLTLLYALATSVMALLASMQRAESKPHRLVAGTLLRTVFVLVAVCGVAPFVTVPLVVATEIIGTLIASALSWRIFFGTKRDPIPRGRVKSETSSREGLLTFLAFSACAAPFYLDRLFVTTTLGGQFAAQYAVLAIFVTAASLLVNTMAQRIGPEAVRLIHRHGEAARAFRLVTRAIAAISGVWIAVMTAVFLVFRYLDLPHAIDRYRIEPAMLLPIVLSGLLVNSGLLEFLVIGLDRERQFAISALIFLTLTLIAAAAFAIAGATSLLLLMWLLVACRTVYFTLLVLALRRPTAG